MALRKTNPADRPFSTDAGRSLEPVAVDPAPATVPASASAPARPRKFTALLDADTDARYGRVLDVLRGSVGPVATRSDGNGRTRAGYDVSRADLLRALLEVADRNPSVMTKVVTKVREHYGVQP